MHFGFSIKGLIVFILPMIINIIYVIFPPSDNKEEKVVKHKFAEMLESATRMLYMVIICFITNDYKSSFSNIMLYLAIIFLVLYYIVWIRYFIKGRKVEYLIKSFLFVPIPLAIFPVLYFLLAALWLNNYIAAIVMIVFGISHFIVSKN